MNSFRRIVFGLVFGVALAGAASAQQNTWRFNYAGTSLQFFTVPAGVRSLSAIVAGASGGQTNANIARPGGGGIVVGTISVQPGQKLTIWVGGNGNGPTGEGEGGWGLGCGGGRGDSDSFGFDAGGGGGGSAIALDAFLPPSNCGTVNSAPVNAKLLVVAGGGGGGGNSVAITSTNSQVAGQGGAGGNPGVAGDANLTEVSLAGGFGGCGGGGGNPQTCLPSSTGRDGLFGAIMRGLTDGFKWCMVSFKHGDHSHGRPEIHQTNDSH
jgi:hypothetical protein